jgi:predicted nucleic acid-binding protein
VSPVFADTSALFALLVAADANHRRAELAFQGLERNRSRISLVDAASFPVMHANGIAEAFAFDGHFLTAGFELVK